MAGALSVLREKERETRRKIILDAARDLFAEKDFRRVTVREIARQAGVSPGTIYRYYENLDDLFLGVFCAGADEITEMLAPAGKISNTGGLRHFCEKYVRFLNENMTFFQMMGHFMLGGSLVPEKTRVLNPVMRRLIDRFQHILQAAGLHDDSRHTAHALFSALNGIMISYARYPGRTPAEIQRHTIHLSQQIAKRFHPGVSQN